MIGACHGRATLVGLYMLWSSLRAPRDADRSSSHHCLCRLRPHILRTAVRIETDPTVRMAHALKPDHCSRAVFLPCSWCSHRGQHCMCKNVPWAGEIACDNYALRFVFGNDWLRRFGTESNEICSLVRIAKLDAFADLQRPYLFAFVRGEASGH